jgi:TIR domain
MKVFLSWSGELSKSIAHELGEWLPQVIQGIKPWLSFKDIAKGSRWSSEIQKELAVSKAAVFCVTPDNPNEPWLNFEAGAVSNTDWSSKVCTYLFGIKPADITGPLTQFQHTNCTKDDTLLLVKTLNAAQGEAALEERVLERSFAKFWPDLQSALNDIAVASKQPTAPKRSVEDMVEETLNIARELHKQATVFRYRDLMDEVWLPTASGDLVKQSLPSNVLRVAPVNFQGSTLLTDESLGQRLAQLEKQFQSATAQLAKTLTKSTKQQPADKSEKPKDK